MGILRALKVINSSKYLKFFAKRCKIGRRVAQGGTMLLVIVLGGGEGARTLTLILHPLADKSTSLLQLRSSPPPRDALEKSGIRRTADGWGASVRVRPPPPPPPAPLSNPEALSNRKSLARHWTQGSQRKAYLNPLRNLTTFQMSEITHVHVHV